MAAGLVRRGAAGVAILVTLAVAAAPVASAKERQHTKASATTHTQSRTAGARAGTDEGLTDTELRDQLAAAAQLRAQLQTSNAKLAAASDRLERLSAQANTLLQAYGEARDAEREARGEADRAVAQFQQLSTQLQLDRDALGQWAYHIYSGGGSLGDMSAILDMLSKPVAEASDPMAQLSYLSDERTYALERVRSETAAQRDAAARAVEATSRAGDATAAALEAKRQLDAVIVQQKAQVASVRSLHADQVSKAGSVAGKLLSSGSIEGFRATRELRASLSASELVGVADPGNACSDDEKAYPNGRIPSSGLCPLYKAPGESLRPAAAATFSAMSRAYERDTGSPICVTDSYRSLAEQVDVKMDRGRWAATPGRSHHGLGLAVDLCGGINSFGTAAHLWMVQHASLYGWYHPDWAGAGGSLPEPWHWEYAG